MLYLKLKEACKEAYVTQKQSTNPITLKEINQSAAADQKIVIQKAHVTESVRAKNTLSVLIKAKTVEIKPKRDDTN